MSVYAAKDVQGNVLVLTDTAKHVGKGTGGTHVTSNAMIIVR